MRSRKAFEIATKLTGLVIAAALVGCSTKPEQPLKSGEPDVASEAVSKTPRAPVPAPASDGPAALPPEAVEASSALESRAHDWPRYLGPDANSFSRETGINKDWRAKPPKELWRVTLTDNGYSCPSVAGGKVFIVDHKGASDIVRAFDLESGGELWRFAYADAATNRNGYSYATPTCDEGLIYTLSKDGRLHCLDARDGTAVWRLNLVTDADAAMPYWGYAAAPVVDGSKLLVVAGGGKGLLLALDKKTGEIVWRGGGTGSASYASPVIATIRGKRQYIVFGAKGLVGIDPDGGAVLWEAPWDTKHDCHASTPVVVGDRVFITSNYKRGCALVEVGATDTRRVWEHTNIQSHFTTPVLHEGRLYCTSDPGRLVCLDVASGEVVWSRKGFEKGGLCAVDGTLIVCDGKTGDVVMCELNPDGYRELGRIKPLGGQSWPPPIIAHGRLIVRNKKAMVCLDLR